MNDLRRNFAKRVHYCEEFNEEIEALVVAVRLPSGAVEIITNTSDIPNKVRYYMDKYDDEFQLISNPEVRVAGYMFI